MTTPDRRPVEVVTIRGTIPGTKPPTVPPLAWKGLELRAQGMDFDAIGQQIGRSPGMTRAWLGWWLTRITKETQWHTPRPSPSRS